MFCGSGHNHHNFPQKKAEGVGDGATDSEKMMQYRIQLYCKMRVTPQNSILRMGYLIIIK